MLQVFKLIYFFLILNYIILDLKNQKIDSIIKSICKSLMNILKSNIIT